MSIALVGLASFQVYWINNAISLNRQSFNENVILSLRQVATSLERREVANLAASSFYASVDGSNSEKYKFIYREETIDIDGNRHVVIDQDSIPVSEKHFQSVKELTRTTPIGPKNPPLPAGGAIDVIVLGDSVLKSAKDAKFLSRSHMVNVVIEQLISPNAIKDRVNQNVLDSLLHTTFLRNGIDIPYHFGVLDAAKNEIIMGKAESLNELKSSELRASLFPNDILSNANYLLVNFPGQTSYLFRQIWATLAASVLFIIIILGCFTYAIYIIFKQKKISEMKNDFINNMTHELKTPIATVGLAVEALGETEMRSNESTLMRYLGMIKEENNRLSVQVEKVLQSALLDKETFNLKSERIHLHELINSAVEKIQIGLEEKNGSLKVDFQAQDDLVVGDSHHITNVIINILDNALKYSIDTPILQLSTYNKAQGIWVTITDNGIGMDTETLKHIFEKFYRAHTGNRHDVKGFGLGLSYVKTIIDRHEGYVEAESELGKGSTFKIYLPNER
ncbi:MAG: HAMP domain-containing sensor histidine kinase [Fulvivirga sp.]|uniref:sensor histidine kinase n=1 Tax=Fulvivirga sp. TaxID=1931237 RepID=UPI0032EE1056